jgi:hypothetical protein
MPWMLYTRPDKALSKLHHKTLFHGRCLFCGIAFPAGFSYAAKALTDKM